jgi:transcriptional regulator with XRE-family HTH domain
LEVKHYEPTDNWQIYCPEKKREKFNPRTARRKLGVSNKTVSKWECGKCMPDYGIVKPLCQELGITISELMDGEVKDDNSIRVFDEEQILNMLARIQQLERQKMSIFGILLIVMGIALLAFSQLHGGTDFRDFLSGLMMGISVGEMLVGVFIIGRSFTKQ